MKIIVNKYHDNSSGFFRIVQALRRVGGWYDDESDTICIYGNLIFNHVIVVLDHEFLHRVFCKLFDYSTSYKLDNLRDLFLEQYEDLLK